MLKLRTASGHAAIARRIKSWAVARFGAGEEAWLVSEAACRTPGQPARQTVVALCHPAARLVFRLPLPMAAITERDIAALGDAAANCAAEACC